MTQLPHPTLDIGTERVGTVVRLMVRGELDRENSWALIAAMIHAERSGAERVVLDLADVEFLDGGGLRALANAARRGRRMRGGVVVEHPSEPVARLLHLTGLDRSVETR
jgi:anti-sigma B factor antagonist